MWGRSSSRTISNLADFRWVSVASASYALHCNQVHLLDAVPTL